MAATLTRSAAGGSSTPFDVRIVRDVWEMTAGTLRRHPWVLLICMLIGLGSSFAFLQLLPRSYHAEWQLLAQKNLVMPALGNPHRSVPVDSDVPTRGVADLVLSRENLISLIKHTDLLERWPVERAPLLRLKDWAAARIGQPPTEAQRLESLIGILEKKLKVSNDDNSITVAIDWPNAHTAADLLQTAEDSFLEARHASEVSTIAETIGILQGHAKEVHAIIDSTFEKLEAGSDSDGEGPEGAGAGSASGSEGPLPKALPEGYSAEDLAQAQRDARHLRDIETRALGDDTVAAPPDRREPDSSGDRPTETAAAEIAGAEDEDAVVSPTPKASGAHPKGVPEASEEDADETSPGHEEQRIAYPKARLKIALDNYDDLRRRIDAARIELDTAEAAFKYRYRVIQPVVVPQRPNSPHGLVILMSGLVAGLLTGVALAFGRDLSGEVIRASWQVKQRFKVPVLVEIRKE